MKARRRGLSIESLERRQLLASNSDVFVGPSITTLITQAEHGKNTYQATINVVVDSLQAQLTAGPLADLTSGAVTGDGFITESQSMEASYETYVDVQLAAKFPAIDELLKLQGERVVANLISLNQQESVGLISPAIMVSSSRTVIDSLSKGPILAIGTKPAAITASTKAFQAELTTLENDLNGGSLTLQQFNTTLGAEAEAYRNDVHAGIQMTQLRISGEADTDINALELTSSQVAQTNLAYAQTQLPQAIKTFDNAVLDTNGLFGPKGALNKSKPSKLHPSQPSGQDVSVFTMVTGTTTLGGTATLTATLTMRDGSPLNGKSVAFTVDGAFAGVGVTNFHGIATVVGVPSTTAVGVTAVIAATYAGDTNFLPTTSRGGLVVNRIASVVSGVSGTSTFGGPATLQATLNSATGQALAGQTVSFTLDGTSVGSAITDANGLATLTGVATTDAVGTDSGGIIASFAGNTNYAASSKAGNLFVAEALTVLSNVGGTAGFGGTATLKATISSTTTNAGIAGLTINFLLNNASVGSAVTNANGVATLTGVTTSAGIGTEAGAVVASFGGNSNYFGGPEHLGRPRRHQGRHGTLERQRDRLDRWDRDPDRDPHQPEHQLGVRGPDRQLRPERQGRRHGDDRRQRDRHADRRPHHGRGRHHHQRRRRHVRG